MDCVQKVSGAIGKEKQTKDEEVQFETRREEAYSCPTRHHPVPHQQIHSPPPPTPLLLFLLSISFFLKQVGTRYSHITSGAVNC